MIAEAINTVVALAKDPPRIETVKDPLTGDECVGYFNPQGQWIEITKGRHHKFPPVTVMSAQSLIDYAKVYAASQMLTQETVLTVNRTGLSLAIDYSLEGDAAAREHGVRFPAAYDEECATAAAAVMGAIGKWIDLDTFDALLDKCAPFLANFTALEEASSNMEGTETASVKRTATSIQVAVRGEVASTVQIPKQADLRLLFMGNPIAASIPLRVQAKDKGIIFHLVDNGALAKAQAEILRTIKAQVVHAFPELLVIDGSVG